MKNRTLYIRLSEAELAAVQAEAERDERCLSDVVRRCIRKALS